MENQINEQEKNRLYAAAEAVLFAEGEVVSLTRLARILGLSKEDAEELMEDMTLNYDDESRGITLKRIGKGYQLCTKESLHEMLSEAHFEHREYRLTDTVLETLSIIAYRQPVTRSEIEKIRGVSSDHAVNKLVELGLIRELGRLNAPGKPLLFGTTDEFLRCFGISSPEDLPVLDEGQMEDFRKQATDEVYSADVDI